MNSVLELESVLQVIPVMSEPDHMCHVGLMSSYIKLDLGGLMSFNFEVGSTLLCLFWEEGPFSFQAPNPS
jgi:hypothetical protein